MIWAITLLMPYAVLANYFSITKEQRLEIESAWHDVENDPQVWIDFFLSLLMVDPSRNYVLKTISEKLNMGQEELVTSKFLHDVTKVFLSHYKHLIESLNEPSRIETIVAEFKEQYKLRSLKELSWMDSFVLGEMVNRFSTTEAFEAFSKYIAWFWRQVAE